MVKKLTDFLKSKRKALQQFELPLKAALFCIFTNFLDVVTSYIGSVRMGIEEGNPFVRTPFTHIYILEKGIAHKGIYMVAFLIVATIIYLSVKPVNEKAALVASSFFFYFWGLECLLTAVIPNLLFIFNWYAP